MVRGSVRCWSHFCSLISASMVASAISLSTLSWADEKGSYAPGTSADTPGRQAHHRQLSIDSKSFDFGNVEEGVAVAHTFTITNSGEESLSLVANASCGCTTPRLAKKELKPGESTRIEITIDTAMKQNAMTKTVQLKSVDSIKPLLTIDLSMIVLDPHRGMAEGGAKIFTDAKCAACHALKGEQKFGRALYNADCAMCHGPKAEGAVGPPLFGPYKKAEYARFMKDVIEKGSKTHRSMPGFLAAHGGPLSQKQVDSIMDYLGTISKARGL